ncbi:hypothetical protein CAPTEDRAFT_192432 [Capitella teleta]|uniref:Uncharacterized protein n=1 Tax=Capitella teleta TaxID=283909 RepID=R7VCP0_CAPTE|nr:hypothetical protein CAPTEDRAFT_192432 [Capitella teleta]|eukprot:ELU16322.1 hypothetical protein CAPTEDRAFT_192432 [Capitella teleta]
MAANRMAAKPQNKQEELTMPRLVRSCRCNDMLLEEGVLFVVLIREPSKEPTRKNSGYLDLIPDHNDYISVLGVWKGIVRNVKSKTYGTDKYTNKYITLKYKLTLSLLLSSKLLIVQFEFQNNKADEVEDAAASKLNLRKTKPMRMRRRPD